MSVSVVMPAWNEAEGILGFLRELHDSLRDLDVHFFVVDDCSTDGTSAVLDVLAHQGLPVSVSRNEVNLGHGPSTLRALKLGLASDPDLIVAIDGDGQFQGTDVREIIEVARRSPVDVVEGVRTRRNDPAYRRLVSSATQYLVWTRSHHGARDANTPLRAYRPQALRALVTVIPAQARTPNLLISAVSRSWGLSIVEVEVTSLPRRGSIQQGSTWGQSRKSLPSRRFVRFCVQAAIEWFRTPMARRPPDVG